MDDPEWICGAEKRGYSTANPGDVEDFSGYALSSYGALSSRAVFSGISPLSQADVFAQCVSMHLSARTNH